MYKQFSEALETVAKGWKPDTLQRIYKSDRSQLAEQQSIYETMAVVALESIHSTTDYERVRQLCLNTGVAHGNKVITRYIGHVVETASQAGADIDTTLTFLRSHAGYRVLGKIASFPQSIAGDIEYALSIVEPISAIPSSKQYINEVYTWNGNSIVLPPFDSIVGLPPAYFDELEADACTAKNGCPVERANLLEEIYQSYVMITKTDTLAIQASFGNDHNAPA